MSDRVVQTLLQAAEANRRDPLRNANMLCFPGAGQLYIAGDLHNHHRNYEKFLRAADLERHPQRHILLQELIHGGPLGPNGEDQSLDMILHAAQLKAKCPDRVHFLLANHDMAQVQRLAIMKDGYDLTERFTRHVELKYGKTAGNVLTAFREFCYSMPLAAITVTGVFFAHSLPTARDLPKFDATLLRRPLTEADYDRNGPVYQLIWGRFQTQDALNALSKLWWADLFVCGHQPQDAGHGTIGDRMLIIDSSHNHGVYLPLDLSVQYTLADLVAQVRPLAGVM